MEPKTGAFFNWVPKSGRAFRLSLRGSVIYLGIVLQGMYHSLRYTNYNLTLLRLAWQDFKLALLGGVIFVGPGSLLLGILVGMQAMPLISSFNQGASLNPLLLRIICFDLATLMAVVIVSIPFVPEKRDSLRRHGRQGGFAYLRGFGVEPVLVFGFPAIIGVGLALFTLTALWVAGFLSGVYLGWVQIFGGSSVDLGSFWNWAIQPIHLKMLLPRVGIFALFFGLLPLYLAGLDDTRARRGRLSKDLMGGLAHGALVLLVVESLSLWVVYG